jgi:hypothetical protein
MALPPRQYSVVPHADKPLSVGSLPEISAVRMKPCLTFHHQVGRGLPPYLSADTRAPNPP